MMGYAHGTRWSESDVCDGILKVVSICGLKTMPTHSEIISATGDKRLVNALVRYGGTRYFANKLDLPIKDCESELGDTFELYCMEQIKEKFGYATDKMKPRYPYDILVDRNVKIDVKASRLYTTKAKTKFYTFNLEKRDPTCDIFVFYCLDDNDAPLKTLVIPSSVLSGKCQLSIGFASNYDKYENAWSIVSEYVTFYRSMNAYEGVAP